MFSKFNSIASNGNSLSFPGSSRMFINGNGIQTDVGQITTTSSTNSFQKASTIMASNGNQIFPSLNVVQDGLNVQGNILGVLPGAPTITSVANNVNVGEIQVNFTAPSNNGGSTITSYKVYAYNNNTLVNANGISGASSPIYYTGLVSGTSYTFKVSAVNGTGEGALSAASSSVQVVGAPGAPTITSVTSSSTITLTVNFTAGSGFAITGYEYSLNNGSWIPFISPWTISSLSANTFYSVRVRAVSLLLFPGAPSNAFNGLTLPNTPINVSMVSPSPVGAQLAVNYNGNNTSGTGSYGTVTYQYTTDNGSNWNTLPSSGTAFSTQSDGTSPLATNTTYTIAIRANNTTGSPATGGVSSSVTPSGSATTLAAAPTNLSATALSTTQLQISFTAPSGSASISGYQYSFNGSSWLPPSASSSSTITIGGLSANTTYNTIYIKAVNAGGEGASSSSVSGTTLAAAPTGLSATGYSTTQIQISFTAPSGTATSDYKYSFNGSTWTSSGYASSPITIGGLSANTTYNTIYIKAVNAGGDGASSTAVSGTTLTEAPTINTITSTASQTLSIAFSAPSGGAPPITNYKYSTDNGSTFVAMSPAQTSSPLVITTQSTAGTPALVNGTSYNIIIRAVNAGGDGTVSNTVAGTPSSLSNNMDPANGNSYTSQASIAALGATWQNSISPNIPSFTLQSGTAPYTGPTLGSAGVWGYFTMSGSNYWQCANVTGFSLNGPPSGASQTVTIWTQPRYGFTSSFNPMIFYKANGGSANNGYFIYATSDAVNTPPYNTTCSFGFGVRDSALTLNQYTSPSSYNRYNSQGGGVGTPTWYMLSLVAQNVGTAAANFYFYVNGSLQATGSGINTSGYNDTTNNNFATIAANTANGGGNPTGYTGYISTIQQYGSALSSSDVLALFNAQKGNYGY